MTKMRRFLISGLMITAWVVSGCATMEGWMKTSQSLMRDGVEASTIVFLTANPADVTPTIDMTNMALGNISAGTAVDLDSVTEFLIEKIRTNSKQHTDVAKAQEILKSIVSYTRSYLRNKGVPNASRQIVVVTDFLTWINQAAKSMS